MPVLGGCDQGVVAPVLIDESSHGLGDGVSALDGKSTPLAERGLDIDDNERA